MEWGSCNLYSQSIPHTVEAILHFIKACQLTFSKMTLLNHLASFRKSKLSSTQPKEGAIWSVNNMRLTNMCPGVLLLHIYAHKEGSLVQIEVVCEWLVFWKATQYFPV